MADRRIVGAAGVDVPRRLPGGVWGPPATAIRIEWDVNGNPRAAWAPGPLTPISSAPLVAPADVVARSTVQAEMPWPQEWVAFLGVSASRPAAQTPTNPVRVRWAIEAGVESSRFRWQFEVDWTGRENRLLPTEDGFPTGIRIAAQTVRIAPVEVVGGTDPATAGLATTLEFAWLVGLAQPPQFVR